MLARHLVTTFIPQSTRTLAHSFCVLCLQSAWDVRPHLPALPCNWWLLLSLSWKFSCPCFCCSLVAVSNHVVVPRNVKKTLKVTPASGWRTLNIPCLWEANSDRLGNPLGIVPNGLVKLWVVSGWRIWFYHLNCLQGWLLRSSFLLRKDCC